MAGGEKAAKSQIDSILCHPWKDGNNTVDLIMKYQLRKNNSYVADIS